MSALIDFQALAGDTSWTATIPSGTTSSNLTNFPVYLDLSDFPTSFWHRVDNEGGNLRAYLADGTTLIPIDVYSCNKRTRTGTAFVKRSITSASDTEIVFKTLSRGTAALAVSDTNGRNAVWADYTAVYSLGYDPRDRTGNSDNLRVLGDPNFLDEVATTGDINAHEGVATDGVFYYAFDSFAIRKYRLDWTLETEITNIAASYSLGLGGGCVANNKIYVAADNAGTQYLAVFNAADLSFVEHFDIESFANSAADFAYNPDDGLLYTVQYTAAASGGTSSIIKIDPTDGSNQGSITMSAAREQLQGITIWRGAFWLAHDGIDETYRCELDGTLTETGLFGPTTLGGSWEGIDVSPDGDGLIQLHDTGTPEIVRTFKDFNYGNSAGAGLNAFAVSRAIGDLNSTIGNVWTVGISARADVAAAQNYFLGVVPTGAYSGTQSVHIGVDENAASSGQNRIAVFDGSNSWLYSGSNAQISTVNMQRVNVAYNGTTARYLWVNGGDKGTDTTITARATGIAHLNIAAAIENSFTAAWIGDVGGYVYLRESLLSDAWIAAEYANLNSPGTFYSIT